MPKLGDSQHLGSLEPNVKDESLRLSCNSSEPSAPQSDSPTPGPEDGGPHPKVRGGHRGHTRWQDSAWHQNHPSASLKMGNAPRRGAPVTPHHRPGPPSSQRSWSTHRGGESTGTRADVVIRATGCSHSRSLVQWGNGRRRQYAYDSGSTQQGLGNTHCSGAGAAADNQARLWAPCESRHPQWLCVCVVGDDARFTADT